jgi:hypothetical protein
MKRYLNTHTPKTHFVLVALLVLLSVMSCKKVYEDAFFPYHEITGFSIPAHELQAAVTTDSIIVYWPFNIARPAKISPSFTVSEHATVSPASGSEISFETGTRFTVTAQNGEQKSYYLKVVINQPDIIIVEQTYVSYRAEFGGVVTFNTGSDLRNVTRDENLTKVYIIDAANKATELTKEFGMQGASEVMKVNIPATGVTPGAYKLKVTSNGKTAITNDAIFGVLYPLAIKPVLKPVTQDITIKRGSNITFNGTGFMEMKNSRLFNYDVNWNERELGVLEFVSATATTATYKIPSTFPVGQYFLNSYDANGLFIQLRTSDFFGFWSWTNTKPVMLNLDGEIKITVTD